MLPRSWDRLEIVSLDGHRAAHNACPMRTTALLALLLSAAFAAERPNVILVMADDQGFGDMAYTGDPVVKTPNFDQAAAAGLRFDRFYAAAPVCSPTRAAVMTGRHPNRMGVFKWGHPMRPQEQTIAELLKDAGYATGHFGKWHLGSVIEGSPATPGANGFDKWVSAPNFYDNDAVMSDGGKAVPRKGESSMIAVDDALAFIKDSAAAKKPFLAVVWFGSPHLPHQATPEFAGMYKDQDRGRQHFLGEVTGMDAAFGKLRDALGPLGLRENTILWYTSDNGALKIGSTGGHRGYKGSVYDGGLRVPAILEWPARIKAPRATDARCNSSDILPTIADLLGLDTRPGLDGVSLRPLIENREFARPGGMGFWDFPAGGISTPSAKWMAELLAAQKAGEKPNPAHMSLDAARIKKQWLADFAQGHSAWIEGDWKLHRIEGKNGKTTHELYHLADDPAEKENRFADEPQRAEAMRAALAAWQKSVIQSLNGEDY